MASGPTCAWATAMDDGGPRDHIKVKRRRAWPHGGEIRSSRSHGWQAYHFTSLAGGSAGGPGTGGAGGQRSCTPPIWSQTVVEDDPSPGYHMVSGGGKK
jgi:hypothetical protein